MVEKGGGGRELLGRVPFATKSSGPEAREDKVSSLHSLWGSLGINPGLAGDSPPPWIIGLTHVLIHIRTAKVALQHEGMWAPHRITTDQCRAPPSTAEK